MAGADAVSTMRRRVVRGGLALVLVLALVDGVFGAGGLVENMRRRARNAAMAASIEELRSSNEALITDIKRLREDPGAIEELARQELELMKDGELLVILRDVPASSQNVPGAPTSASAR